ncbi:cytochrome-c peroxidase [Lysobacter gummosus]|uniref:Methylamine utilization protein n=1 Tax=Lysobacter gummosus TaxID=262324 RepID=A0ABY3XAF5_9GAMM|nr:cytochrome c peroxidase [Lysobacter gummosus]ALN92878.1 cytochrome c family protein [Lysobacter gummosus]UNP28421.1 methylamine utilization protein [Lysobacter gummosus]
MRISLKPRRWLSCLAIALAALAVGCGQALVPAATDARWAALGGRLFADTRLGGDGRTGCISCHRPEHAFSDGRPLSLGVRGQTGTRNAPTLLDVGELPHLFWDGRETRLEQVVLQPMTNPVEMGLGSIDDLLRRLRADPKYAAAFADVGGVSTDAVATALAAHLRTLRSGDSAYDRYRSGNRDALSPDEQAGLALFTGKAACSDCHVLQEPRPRFTDDRFHHLGINDNAIAGKVATLIPRLDGKRNLGHLVLTEVDIAGLGHFVASRKPADLAAFRTPSLRNVALTAPYMHDGSVATLEEAVEQEVYYRGINKGRPLSMTVEERRQLLTFLKALSAAQ